MKEEFKPAIDALVADLREQERRIATTKQMINRLCELAGAPAMFADVSLQDRPIVTGIRSDHFYGKVQTTAAREYLELRHAANRACIQRRNGGTGVTRPAIPHRIVPSGGSFPWRWGQDSNARRT